MTSSNLLKSYRGRRLKSQKDVAKLLNVTRQTYTNWENNPISVETNVLFNILLVLEVDESEVHDFFNALEQDYLSYKKRTSGRRLKSEI